MGGKNKGNRTKNNAKPSSSARSAELLGNKAPTIFGLSAIVKDGSIAVLPETSTLEMDTNIDANFQLALKKMGKKDATTKLKALQEFSELCKKANVEEVKAILPFWPRLYAQLCSDMEHRVREAAHHSHKVVIVKVKKHLAPYLKEIIGPWYSSQFDTYAPAASVARGCFEEAFSPKKMVEVVSFCQDELLNYFYQNIVVHTSTTLTNPKVHSEEEIADKYRRVVSSSLLGYASYLQNVSKDSLRVGEEGNKRIISSPKFWKSCQAKDPDIRLAFHKSLISLCQWAGWLLEAETQRLASSIVNSLSDDDSLVLPAVWEALLHCFVSLPDCWNQINIEKQLLPKFYHILRCGGKGHASSIFPKILPLLSALPQEKISNKTHFLRQIFANMRSGLVESSVNRSASESRVVAGTYIESLQYMIMINRDDQSLVELLIEQDLIGAVVAVCAPNGSNLLTAGPLFYHLSHMLKAWYRNAPMYDFAIHIFWSSIEKLFREKLSEETPPEECEQNLKKQTFFLSVLNRPNKYAAKGRERVHFSSNDELPAPCTADIDLSPVPVFNEALLKFAEIMTTEYVEHFSKTKSCIYLQALLQVGASFKSGSIYNAALAKYNLLELFASSSATILPQDIFLSLGLGLLPYLPEDAQESIVEKLSERDDRDIVILCQGLKACTSNSIRGWIKKDTFSEVFLKLVNDYTTGRTDEAPAADAISFFLSPVIINNKTCEKLVDYFHNVVDKESTVLKNINVLMEACGKEIFGTSSFQRLFTRLFSLACMTNGESYQQLLQTCIRKLRAFAIVKADSWTDFITTVKKELFLNQYNVDRTLAMILKLVEAACDVDLTEACDTEEVKEAIPLVRVFLEPPPDLWTCAVQLKAMAINACELSAECKLSYFELKAGTERVLVAINEDALAGSNPDPEIIRAYRFAHESARKFATKQLDKTLVAMYLKWLKLSTALLNAMLSAYPTSAKFEEMSMPGRYVVDNHFKVMPDQLDVDIISWQLSEEEWEELDDDAKVHSVFSKEEYPDVNLIVPIGNCLLDIIEGTAIIDLLLKFQPEMEWYPLLSEEFSQLRSELKWAIATATPMEVNFVYNACRALACWDASWRAIMPALMPILHRRFTDCHPPCRPSVETTVINILRPPGLLASRHQILRLVAIVKHHAHRLTLDHWNDVFIQLENVLKSLQSASMENEDNILLAASVSSFFIVTQDCFLNCLKRKDEEKLEPELIRMWNAVVEKELWCHLYAIWCSLFLHGVPTSPEEALVAPEAIEKLKQVVPDVAVRQLCNGVLAGLNIRQPEPLKTTLALTQQLSCLLLMASNSSLQLTAFHILLTLVPELVQVDTLAFQSSVSDTPDDEDKALFTRFRDCDWTMKRLQKALLTSQGVVDTLLAEFKLGDSCTVQAFSDAFTYTHGHLLLCCVMLEMCGEAHVALRFQYGLWLKNESHLSHLLKALFNLMPAQVLHNENRDYTSRLFDCFYRSNLNGAVTSEWIERSACYSYRLCLQWLPAAVREWYSDLEHHVANLVALVTSTHVSPLLITSELKAVQSASVKELENISIAVSPISREVIGTYVIDEASMQIIISLPNNYPLGTIKVDFKTQVVPRAWRISMFLVHRNGSIRDALALWKSDLDKKFEGVDECEICFSILHGPNFDVPKQSCKTCRKKFHSACLYKWFNTSNKSSCPHCRNQF